MSKADKVAAKVLTSNTKFQKQPKWIRFYTLVEITETFPRHGRRDNQGSDVGDPLLKLQKHRKNLFQRLNEPLDEGEEFNQEQFVKDLHFYAVDMLGDSWYEVIHARRDELKPKLRQLESKLFSLFANRIAQKIEELPIND